MTATQCSAVMRLFVFMALALGFLGFLANARPNVGSLSAGPSDDPKPQLQRRAGL
jgi:hypothetical protein